MAVGIAPRPAWRRGIGTERARLFRVYAGLGGFCEDCDRAAQLARARFPGDARGNQPLGRQSGAVKSDHFQEGPGRT